MRLVLIIAFVLLFTTSAQAGQVTVTALPGEIITYSVNNSTKSVAVHAMQLGLDVVYTTTPILPGTYDVTPKNLADGAFYDAQSLVPDAGNKAAYLLSTIHPTTAQQEIILQATLWEVFNPSFWDGASIPLDSLSSYNPSIRYTALALQSDNFNFVLPEPTSEPIGWIGIVGGFLATVVTIKFNNRS